MLEKGIVFEEKDIHDNDVFFQEFKELGGQGTPFTITKENGVIKSKILGFNQKKIMEELTK